MSQYLLSVHSVEGEARPEMTPEEMEASMAGVNALEAEMVAAGAFVFGGALHGPEAATVVRAAGEDGLTMTDGPFAEAKEHIGGFYVIEAEDLDAALAWAGKTVECINAPIEVRPFAAVSSPPPS